MPKEPSPVRKIRLFVASPGDVSDERDRLKRVVDEINATVAPFKNCVVELVRWETHVNPGMGRPQSIVNSQIGSYDIFLGIMWRRFGTPTGVANSGTEEEFRRAYQCWEADQRTQILFYFNQAPFSPRTEDELQQAGSVLRFRNELESRGLVSEYRDSADFPDVVRPHLYRIIMNFPDERGEFVPHPSSPKTPSPIRVFIGSSSEGLRTAKHIKEALVKMGIETTTWVDEAKLNEAYSSTLDRVLDTCNAAVMVLTPDDRIMTRHATRALTRDNFVYEIGLFVGRMGRNRTFVLATDDTKLPSDLEGIAFLRFDAKRPGPALNQLRRELLTITNPTMS
jgi:predicted nucleotide-binding protein